MTNCPECHFEPENGHALTCSKYVPRVYKSTDYLKVKTTEYKPKGELTDDFSKTDNTAERHAIRNVLRQPPKKEPKLEFPKSAEEEYTPTFEELYGKQSPTDTAGENDLINGWAKIARTTTKSAETSTDTSEEWEAQLEKLVGGFNWAEVKSFVESEKQRSFEEGVQFGRALEETETEAPGSFKSGHAAALSKVKELAEGLTLKMNVDDYLPKVEAWDRKTYDVPFDDGYKQAKADLLDHLKTIE